ncbi:MAG: apolipoprotein N-acyltransferase [Pseudomonadota bacterium]
MNRSHLLYLSRLLCVFASGLISAFAMAPTFYWPFLLVGLSVFYVFYAGTKHIKSAALMGFLFSLGYHLHGLFWVGNALLVEGNSYRWVWPLAVIGLPILLSIFTALFTALARKFSDPRSLIGFLFSAGMLATSEWIRGHIFTGFPWNLYGHTWIASLPILQIVNLFGMYALTLFTIIWLAFPGYLLVSKHSLNTRALTLFLMLASILAVYLYGAMRLDNNPTRYDTKTSVRVVQPNIRQDLKWKPELLADHFMELASLSQHYSNASKDPDHKTYIVWPETAMPPQILDSVDAGRVIQETLASFPHKAYLLAGALRVEHDQYQKSYYNSMVILNAYQEGIGLYDKSHLVPFGEYIPFQRFIPLKPVVKFNGFIRGEGTQTLTIPEAHKLTPLICYEVIFPAMAKGGKKRPDMIVNITNDAWYGDSAGPYQHFMQTIIRAVEFGVPVVRSANTGISGLIDPYGRIITQTNLFQKSALTNPLPLKTESKTLFHKIANLSFFIFSLIIVLLNMYIRKS